MKKSLVIAVATLSLALAYWLLKPAPSTDATFRHSLPWQIDTLPEGRTQVFGLILGESTLGEALTNLGEDHQMAVIINSDDVAGLEVYASHFRAGPLKGKLIISAFTDESDLEAMRQRASDAKYMASGARRFLLAPEDRDHAEGLAIRSISFIPDANLDAEIITGRFGEPAQIIASGEELHHYLYPALGLDITLNSKGKELLQYVAPRDFALLAEPLQSPGGPEGDASAQ